jgi:GNAT superfamily N-acetyltransferase
MTNPESNRPEINNADALNNPKVSIVELSPDDWQVLRDLKLKSLQQEPIAFEDVGEATEKWTNRTEAEWRSIVEGKMTQGREGESVNIFVKDEINENYPGMVSAIIPEGSKIATVQHMYVDNEGYRGKGIGKQLLQELIDRVKTKSGVKK